MPEKPVLRTERLLLRPWRDDDLPAIVAMQADPRVTEFLFRQLDRTGCEQMLKRIDEHYEQHGFGWWAVEVVGVTPFAGLVGLLVPWFEAHFTPCVEIGWRLRAECWGKGYAVEAARACLKFAFDQLKLDEVVAFTVPVNVRSRRVMEQLNMVHSPADDFDHPAVEEGHALRRHCLYRISKERFASETPSA